MGVNGRGRGSYVLLLCDVGLGGRHFARFDCELKSEIVIKFWKVDVVDAKSRQTFWDKTGRRDELT